jgi:hypothetical protein
LLAFVLLDGDALEPDVLAFVISSILPSCASTPSSSAIVKRTDWFLSKPTSMGREGLDLFVITLAPFADDPHVFDEHILLRLRDVFDFLFAIEGSFVLSVVITLSDFPTHVDLLWWMGWNLIGFSIKAEIASRTERLATATNDPIQMRMLRREGRKP